MFFAVACLCLGPLFRGSPGARVFGALLVANGMLCLLGMAAGYVWRVRILNVLFFNGMGLTALGFSLVGFLIL